MAKSIQNGEKYLSGWQVLNVPNAKGETADWHSACYFDEKRKPRELYIYDENSPLGAKGIERRYISYLGEEYYAASFARAIADLVWSGERRELKNCVCDYLSDEDAKELFGYLKIINESRNVEDFMRLELTKLYFADKAGERGFKTRGGPTTRFKFENTEDKIRALITAKTANFTGRETARELFDIDFLLDNFGEYFSKFDLEGLKIHIDYAGEEELNLLAMDEYTSRGATLYREVDFTCFAQEISEKIEKALSERK